MLESLRQVLAADARVRYALLFGSLARRRGHAGSDVDVAVELSETLDPRALGDLIGRLEAAAGRSVDLVLIEEAPPPLAYRVFRDGIVLVERDHAALVARKARAILDYLDFKPVDDLCTRGVLAAARRGR